MRRMTKNKGLTLVELLIAMAIIGIVFAAVVPQFRAIRKSWSGAEASAAMIANGRVLTEHITRNLAAAVEVIDVSSSTATNGYIEFQDNNGATKRYMVTSGYVVYGNKGSEAQLAGPVSKFQISCFSVDDFEKTTTDVNDIRLVQFETIFPNSNDSGSDRVFNSEVFIRAGQSTAGEQDVIDVYVYSGDPDTAFDYSSSGSYSCDAVVDIDNKIGSSGKTHGLLMFKDIVGDSNEQIPENTEISEALLKLYYVNHNGNSSVYFYPMTVDWNESSTWNSIGGGVWPGKNCNSSEVITASLGNSVPKTVEVDVTDIVQNWIDGDYTNYGFGIINSSNNNLQFAAAENTTPTAAHTPKLQVSEKGSVTDAGIVANGYIYLYGSGKICDSYNSSQGKYSSSNSSENATLALNTNGYMYIYYTTVYGDAYVGPGSNPSTAIREYYGGQITGEKGTLDETIDMTLPTAPTGYPFNGASKGSLQLRNNDVLTLSEDAYYTNIYLLDKSDILVTADVTLMVSNMLRLYTDKNEIIIEPGASLTLYVGGYLYSAGKLNAQNDNIPSDLVINFYNYSRMFYMYSNAESYCLVNNPGGYVYVLSTGDFYGRAKGNYFYARTNVHIDLDSNIGSSAGGGSGRNWTFGGDVISGEILP